MYQVIPLRPPNTSGDLEPTTAQYLRLVTWAPTGNGLAYVDYNNNIHYRYILQFIKSRAISKY